MLLVAANGAPVRNPAVQVMRDQAMIVRAYAQELGLTPAARVALRIPGSMAYAIERSRAR